MGEQVRHLSNLQDQNERIIMFLRFSTFRTVAASLLLSGALVTAPAILTPVHAQDSQSSPTKLGPDSSPMELMNYVLAVNDVQRIGQSYEARIQTVQSNEELKELSDRRMGEMVNAVEGRGITVEEYNAIFKASQVNKELSDEINTIAKQVVGGQ